MPEEAKINFYSIRRCGFYKHGKKESVFSELPTILGRLQNWTMGGKLKLEDTCTFSLKETEDNGMRTFCFDIVPSLDTDDFFITTWNETPSNKGRVPSVSADQPVGAAKVHLNSIQKGTIPGYATYFWFIPELDIFATIRFQHVLNGHQNLVRYMNGFLENFSGYTVTKQIDDDTVEIEGYRESQKDEIQDLFPSFKTRLLRKTGEIELVKQKRASIRKMIRKSELDLQIRKEKKLLKRMLSKFGVSNNADNGDNAITVNYSFNYTPNDTELTEIIDQALEEGLSWTNDYGFQFNGKPDILWLSNSIVKHNLNLDIERDNDEIVNLHSLSKQLTEKRQLVTNIIREIQ